MTRKELEALGLDKEQIDTIMDLNGKAINKANLERDEAINKYTEAQEELAKREKDLEELKNNSSASEELKSKLEEISAEYEEYKNNASQREQELKLNSALGLAIAKSGTLDEVSLKANLDMESIELSEDGSLKGFDEQLEKLKQEKSFLFGKKLDGGLEHQKPPKKDNIEDKIRQGLRPR